MSVQRLRSGDLPEPITPLDLRVRGDGVGDAGSMGALWLLVVVGNRIPVIRPIGRRAARVGMRTTADGGRDIGRILISDIEANTIGAAQAIAAARRGNQELTRGQPRRTVRRSPAVQKPSPTNQSIATYTTKDDATPQRTSESRGGVGRRRICAPAVQG